MGGTRSNGSAGTGAGGAATAVGANLANMTGYGRADIILRDGTLRKARTQPGYDTTRWVFLEDYLSG